MNILPVSRAAAAPMAVGFIAALALVASPVPAAADHHLENGAQSEPVEQAAPAAGGVEVKTAHCGCSEGYSKGGCGECNGLGAPPADASVKVGEADAEYERAPCGCMRKKSKQ